jgi:hypothetical protein
MYNADVICVFEGFIDSLPTEREGCQMPNAKCQIPNAKCQMPNAECQTPDARAPLLGDDRDKEHPPTMKAVDTSKLPPFILGTEHSLLFAFFILL